MDQALGNFFVKVATDFGLSVAVLVGVIFYFIRKEKRLEDKDKEVTSKLISTIDKLASTIDDMRGIIHNNSNIVEEVKEQNDLNVRAIDGLNNNFKMLNQHLDLMKKIDTQEQGIALRNIEAKLEEIKARILEIKR